MFKTTLEQWAILDKVVELGGFNQAAEAMNRSQSSVSYNLSLLQERLGISLLRIEGRRALLTPQGETLLAQVRPLLNAFHVLESRAASLHDGARTQLELVVDNIFPRQTLFRVLQQFQQQYPATQIQLTEVLEYDDPLHPAVPEADVMVMTRREDVSGRGQWLMNVDFLAVIHRDHPLLSLAQPLTEYDLSRYPQIRIGTSRSQAPHASVGQSEQWFFSTVDTAVEAVMHQVGYGWLPQERIDEALRQGVLQPLPLNHGGRRSTPMHLIVKKELIPLDDQVIALVDLFTRYCSGQGTVSST
ncbi:LysR family transcriptional regulator [Pantoea cypripedii]|uniref:LysR family transcriptional regulator n=1 Tax=Pantoea cypripedii TaxID=55209 RepID=UPI002FC58AB6